MEALKLENRKYSPEEYLEIVKGSLHKLELHLGTITMMAGGSRNHAEIVDNTFVALRTKQSGCHVKSSETAISVQETNSYFFPDISATCKEPEFEEGGIARMLNPELIIEVLSLSTERRDKSIKWDAYMSIDSLKEYVLIDSKSMSIQTYFRQEKGSWSIGNYYLPEHDVVFKTLGISVSMSVIYSNVKFPELGV